MKIIMQNWGEIVQRKWYMSIFLVLTLQLCIVSSSSEESKLVASINDFSYNFYRQLTVEQKSNFICSPYSAAVALSMLLVGAKAETAAEISQTLGLQATGLSIQQVQTVYHKLLSAQNTPISGFDLSLANSLWVKLGSSLIPDFRSAIEKDFFAIGKEIDFEKPTAINEVNEYISNATKGKISDMLKKLDQDTFLLLINAIYFKGEWQYSFNETLTSTKKFHNAFSESVTNVPMMRTNGKYKFTHVKSLNAKMLRLPYKGNEYSMLILLPDENKGLLEVEKKLTANIIDDAIKKSRLVETIVDLPRFNLSTTVPLKNVLKSLGTKRAFTQGDADLSGINGNLPLPLFVSDVIQSAICEVNEKGTIAAAATVVKVSLIRSMAPRPLVFSVDHPFLFLIRHETSGIILFMGRVLLIN